MSRFTEVAPGVLVGSSRKMKTNTTVVAASGAALLIDPGWLPDELEGIADFLFARHLKVVGGFATHAHHDHLLWHPGLGAAPRWASATTAELARTERDALVSYLGPDFPAELVDLLGQVQGVAEAIPHESVPAGFEVELVIHDGHAPGHTALWLPRERVLVAGDMLSDVELPLPFYPDDLSAYLVALDMLAPFVEAAEIVIPGHGNVGDDSRGRLDADRRYIDDVLRTGDSDDPRQANPGMAEEHAHMRRLARG